MKISKMITDKYKLRIPPTVYYDLLADVVEIEEQEPTTKNDLGVDCISRKQAIEEADKLTLETGYDNEKVEEMLRDLPSVTPQEPTDKNFTKADIDAIAKAINKGWELRVNEIVSKIRAEILEEHENAYAREDDDTAYGLSMALDILDKYKAESEVDNGHDD